MKEKQEILDTIAKLLDAKDCTVRIQRELQPLLPGKDNSVQTYETSKRLTIIVVGTHP